MNPAKTWVFLDFCGFMRCHARTNPQPIRNQLAREELEEIPSGSRRYRG